MKKSAFTCANDNTIGPVVFSNCRGGFDFTLLFEQVFLLIRETKKNNKKLVSTK